MTPLYEQTEHGIVPLGDDTGADVAVTGIERADDLAIVQRMTTGLGAKAFLYDFPINTNQGTKHVIGISSAGADEMAKQLGNMETLIDIRLDKDSDPDYIYAMVRVKDLIRNVTLVGVGRQCKFNVGRGNVPDHDHMDEHAFVKAITKGQRNAILHHVSEDTVLKIINTYQTQGKTERIQPPAVGTEIVKKVPVAVIPQPPKSPAAIVVDAPAKPVQPPTTTSPSDVNAATAQAIAEQQERLKNLRVDVNNRFMTDLGMTREKRQEACKNAGLPESLTEMNEEQLRKALSVAEDMIQEKIQKSVPKAETPRQSPPSDTSKPVPNALGFETGDEQAKLRGRLYGLLTDPEQIGLTAEEARKFISDRGFTSSSVVPKDKMVEFIQEAEKIIETKKESGNF